MAHSDDDDGQQQQQQRRKSHDKRGQKQLCRSRVLNKYRISRGGGIIPTFTGQKDGNNGVTRSEDGSLLQVFSEQT